jgi:capsular polysaccharide biosynthesis protein
MANENQVEDIIRQHGNMMHFQVVDLATMSYLEQIHTIRSSNIIIGIHGAGLTWIMFAAEEAVLLEIHPSYREDRHFRHIARLTGKDYLPMRSVSRESCQLTSDNVEVPITEFLGTLNEAVRLARNYDSGISECGLHCPSEILAFDERLAPFYDNTSILNYQFTKISKSLDKTFPCPMQT